MIMVPVVRTQGFKMHGSTAQTESKQSRLCLPKNAHILVRNPGYFLPSLTTSDKCNSCRKEHSCTAVSHFQACQISSKPITAIVRRLTRAEIYGRDIDILSLPLRSLGH